MGREVASASSSCTSSRTTGPAIALYERLGYEREGLPGGHYRRGDGYVDAILMAKDASMRCLEPFDPRSEAAS